MKVYKSQAKDIDLPEIDILTFLFGEFVNCSTRLSNALSRYSQHSLASCAPGAHILHGSVALRSHSADLILPH